MVLQKPPSPPSYVNRSFSSFSFNSSRLLLLLCLLFLVLLLESVLVVDCAVSGRAIPNFPKRFRTTIQQGDRQLTRTVDLLQHRIRIEDPKAKTTTIYRGDEQSVFWIRGDRCRRSSFFGGLTSEFMDHIPENSTYHTRAKAQNLMCEQWRHNGTNLCLNYFLTYDQKYFFQNKERHPLRELPLNPELEVLPRLKEIPPPLTLVTITTHPPNSCDDKPIRTIDFLDFTILSSTAEDGGGDEVPGVDEETFSSLFQPPIGLVCQDSTFSSFTSLSSSASSSVSSSSSSTPIPTFSSGEP